MCKTRLSSQLANLSYQCLIKNKIYKVRTYLKNMRTEKYEGHELLEGISIAVFGVGLVLLLRMNTTSDSRKQIQTFEQVQPGYVVPSELEIKSLDLYGDKQAETVIKYRGKEYLFTLDELGNPRVQAYKTEPAEFLPKE